MKAIFLDFDGVLNSEGWLRRTQAVGLALDPTCLERLRRLVTETGARLVLSTSWREHWRCDPTGEEIDRLFAQYGLCVWDKTPHLGGDRAAEIKAWLISHPETQNYVILDDRPFELGEFCGNFVRTSSLRGGLSERDVREAVDILQKA